MDRKSKRRPFWFRLWDLRHLVADDTPGVIEAPGRLRNTRDHDRPVSLYGGMVELPLIVTRDDGARPAPVAADRDLLTSGLGRARRRPPRRHPALIEFETATRTFLASAEAVFRARRDDPAFDFSGKVRALVMGVGCEGALVRIARAKRAGE